MQRESLRYIKGTTHYYINYSYDGESTLLGYVDSDWGGDTNPEDQLLDTSTYLEEDLSAGTARSNKLWHFQAQKQSTFQDVQSHRKLST